MALTELPDFAATLDKAGGVLDAAELAECHGVACGLVCRRPDSGPGDYLLLLQSLRLSPEGRVDLSADFERVFAAATAQLDDPEMRLTLWLPGDDEPLEDRTLALAQWCTGFLAGIGSGGDGLEGLSEDAAEALEDLRQIARAEAPGGGSEEEERAFAQVVEYLRVIAMLFREELRGPSDADRIH